MLFPRNPESLGSSGAGSYQQSCPFLVIFKGKQTKAQATVIASQLTPYSPQAARGGSGSVAQISAWASSGTEQALKPMWKCGSFCVMAEESLEKPNLP